MRRRELIALFGIAAVWPLTARAQAAAPSLRLQLRVLQASTERDLDAAFATVAQMRLRALMIMPDAFFSGRSEQLATLALRHAIPTAFRYRPFAAAGSVNTTW